MLSDEEVLEEVGGELRLCVREAVVPQDGVLLFFGEKREFVSSLYAYVESARGTG